VLFVFSKAGFTEDSLKFLKEHGIAWSEDIRWISEFLKADLDTQPRLY